MIYEIVVDSILHIAILFTFILVLWYVVIRKYQQKQINELISQFLENTSDTAVKFAHDLLGTFGQREAAHDLVRNIADTLMFDLEEKQRVVQRDRTNVANTGIIVAVLLWLMVCLAMYTLYLRDKVAALDVIKINLTLFIALGAVEYIFYNSVIKRYIPITESEIRNEVYKQLEIKLRKIIHSTTTS